MGMTFDETMSHADGELWVRPLFIGEPRDPFSIFRDPEDVRSRLAGVQTRLGAFPEASDHIFLGSNLVVDLGRQALANLVGGRDLPDNDWVVTKASWGTYDAVPRFTDSTLSPQPVGMVAGGANEIVYKVVGPTSYRKKAIFSVDWPQPFITRFEVVLAADEANGTLLREMGLWTENERLFARKVFPAIDKNSSFGLSFLWRVRF